MFEKLFSFFKKDEDFSEKLKDSKNPFLGTLSLIWVIRNWQIVYAIFLDDRPFDVRLEFIKCRISATTFWEIIEQFGINVGLTILAIIVIYLLVYFTRLITNIFENRILPWIYKLSFEGKIVLKTEKDKIEKEKNILEERLRQERGLRLNAEEELEKREKRERERFSNALEYGPSRTVAEQEKMELEQDANSKNEKLIEKTLKEFDHNGLSKVLDTIITGYDIQVNEPEYEITKVLARRGFIKSDSVSGTYITYKMTSLGDQLSKRL